MRIRKYLIIYIFIFFVLCILFLFCLNKYYHQLAYKTSSFTIEEHEMVSKIINNKVNIYNNGWTEFTIKGVRISSFYPGYEKNKSGISKEKVTKWLNMIAELNANTILVPYIQPVQFYDAIYEYNTTHNDKIYTIHEISHDLKNLSTNYDMYNQDNYNEFLARIKRTIDTVHGRYINIDDNISHIGIYIKDISLYNLGYIIGSNTTSELVSITNMRHPDITSYTGDNYEISDAGCYEVVITKLFDEIYNYETTKYNRESLLSYVFSVETDPFRYETETNASSFANIDLSKISTTKNNLFISLTAHPNDSVFLDVSYYNDNDPTDNFYYDYLSRYSNYFELPIIVTELGISSSRGISKVNLSDDYNRGGFNEKEQAELIIELLENAKKAAIDGVFIDSFIDDWSRNTSSNLKNIIDKDKSIYWYDAQASDEAFGLLSYTLVNNKYLLDGIIDEWKNDKYLINDETFSLKAHSDRNYLYLLVSKKNWQLLNDRVYLAIDIIDGLGSNYYQEEDVSFKVEADFLIEFKGVNSTDLLVNDRYDIFSYSNKYYENVLSKLDTVPDKNSNHFSSVYMLNRRLFYDRITGQVMNSIYYDTGDLLYGSTNETMEDYTSLADFKKQDDYVEIRLPWTLINVIDPFSKTIHDDFYINGITSGRIIKNIKFSLTYNDNDNNIVSDMGVYQIPNFSNEKYTERKKDAYYSVQNYWR